MCTSILIRHFLWDSKHCVFIGIQWLDRLNDFHWLKYSLNFKVDFDGSWFVNAVWSLFAIHIQTQKYWKQLIRFNGIIVICSWRNCRKLFMMSKKWKLRLNCQFCLKWGLNFLFESHDQNEKFTKSNEKSKDRFKAIKLSEVFYPKCKRNQKCRGVSLENRQFNEINFEDTRSTSVMTKWNSVK